MMPGIRLERELAKVRKQLAQAEMIIEAQKKYAPSTALSDEEEPK